MKYMVESETFLFKKQYKNDFFGQNIMMHHLELV